MKNFRIGIDADNGDTINEISTTERVVQAVSLIAKKDPNLKLVLAGNEKKIQQIFRNNKPDSVIIIPSSAYYTKGEEITRPVKGTSLNLLVDAVRDSNEDNRIDCFFSIGDTNKVVVESSRLQRLRVNKGRVHPALVALMATVIEGKDCLLTDAGAMNSTDSYQVYCQGLMAAAYAEQFFGIKRPRLGVLCNGTEDHKGSNLVKELDELLKQKVSEKGLSELLDYKGKVEPETAMIGDLDILLTDGFTGNVYLKTIEGTIKTGPKFIRQEYEKLRGLEEVSAFLGKKSASAVKQGVGKRLDPQLYNGSILLGHEWTQDKEEREVVIVKGHGASTVEGIYSGILRTICFSEKHAGNRIKEVLAKCS